MEAGWVRQIRDRCLAGQIPFFFKQWGGVSKATAGRKLDGRVWDEVPKKGCRWREQKNSWRSLCEKYSQPDGLPTWEEAGHWTIDKLYFWKRYIDITTAAMCGPKGRRAFPDGLVYVDLFGGAGVCSLKSRSKKRFPGSTIIAAHAAKPFQKIIVCEQHESLADLATFGSPKPEAADRYKILVGRLRRFRPSGCTDDSEPSLDADARRSKGA